MQAGLPARIRLTFNAFNPYSALSVKPAAHTSGSVGLEVAGGQKLFHENALEVTDVIKVDQVLD